MKARGRRWAWGRLGRTAGLLAGLALGAPLAPGASPGTSMPGSVAELPAWGSAEAVGAPVVVLPRVLSAGENNATLTVAVVLRMRDFSELTARLARGERISRAEMAARYYPRPADYQRVLDWVGAEGLTVTRRDPSRLSVMADGTVAQLAAAFQVQFRAVRTEEEESPAATSAPTVPADLAPLILSINGLQPAVAPHRHALLTALGPNWTGGDFGPPYLPSQISQTYDASTANGNGGGETIGIVIDTFPATTDLTTFWSYCGIPQSLANIAFIQVVPGTLPAPSGEESLDVEWSSAIAPGAKVRVYATVDLAFVHLDEAYQQIFDDLPSQPTLQQVSLSYGLGETYASKGEIASEAQYFANLASAGVSVLVASGDGGSNPGTAGRSGGPVQVETPASDAHVTAVGGTTLTLNSSTGSLVSETAWSGSGGGVSIAVARPLWQVGTGVPTGTTRLVPDVAAPADPNAGAFLVLDGAGYSVGGTSWGAPTWAGFTALLNQARARADLPSLGLLGPWLYPGLGTGELRDITAGSNGADGVYDAGPGYDLCTGVGVPDVGALLQVLTLQMPAIGGPPASQSASAGQTVVFAITASGVAPLLYQWQVSQDGGQTWTNLSDGAGYLGSATATLQITDVAPTMSGNEYRCVVTDPAGSSNSAPALLTVAAVADTPALPPALLGCLAAALVVVAVPTLAGSRPPGS